MIGLESAGILAGGLGLFLLGMGMMTDGLKLAAGPALHRILSGATRTRWHALGSGAMVTALVQSSSAVTVAAIGFVNAGLLGLSPAIWVLFGANVGTTMTGWIVALIGLKFKVEALALPLVLAGVLLRLTGERHRRGAIGSALAGFGLLFLGISLLQQAFSGLAGQINLPQGTGALDVLAQLGIGVLMTVLMQSSSAAMTIALTAAQSGLLDAQGAAAVVIGANVGTTVTAVLAAIGATPNARRVAAAHVAFNVLTGTVALLLLPWLVGALGQAREAMDMPADPASKLALFHTTFNLLGVLLMWPVADRLTRWLTGRFRAREDDLAQPRFLDDNVLAVPTLAIDALEREVERFGQMARSIALAVVAGAQPASLILQQGVLSQLEKAIQTFVERMNRAEMSLEASQRLAGLLRALRYHETCAEQAAVAAPVTTEPSSPLAEAPLPQGAFIASTRALLQQCEIGDPADLQGLEAAAQAMERAYQALKAAALGAGASGRLPLDAMEEALRRYSALRRAVQQAVKARRWMSGEAKP